MSVPHFDRQSVEIHARLINGLAADAEGVLLVVGIDKAEKVLPRKFAIGDVTGMVDMVMAWDGVPGMNVYMPYAVFRRDLPLRSKGGEGDVRYVLALVADQDNDTGKRGDLPLAASYRVETSPGNFQEC